ncbi:MAG TPA: hypothetical protein ENN57_03590 [Chloroflexi bacterium]|nr:hypothetical protein [Chloroflexota bacterium]
MTERGLRMADRGLRMTDRGLRMADRGLRIDNSIMSLRGAEGDEAISVSMRLPRPDLSGLAMTHRPM